MKVGCEGIACAASAACRPPQLLVTVLEWWGKTGVRDAPMDNIVAVHHEVRQNLSRNLLEHQTRCAVDPAAFWL